MKNSKKIVMLFILIFLLLIGTNKSFAESKMEIVTDNEIVKQGEETQIRIEINNANVAALTLEVFWDNTRLEYISGPDNSNYSNNRIIYTWVSDTGVGEDKINVEGFVFRGCEDGIANITVAGEFYTANGEKVGLDVASSKIQIGEILKPITQNLEMAEEKNDNEIIIRENNVSDDNADLSVLRLNREGISPDFNKYIKEYFFIADESVTSLEITAIPENPDSVVTVSGNNNLKMGKNVININVQSKDKSKISEYKIYVTKTNNFDRANANLEILAIRDGTLNPEFDANVTRYSVEMANNVNKIEILAIPQKENARVNILGNEEIKIGLNKIEVVVTAEDGITSKKYEVDVYRRNESEEIQDKEEQEEAEKIATELQEKYSENSFNDISNDNISDENVIKENKHSVASPVITVIVAVCIGIAGVIMYHKK